jgi:D-glycerate 3-kinase
MMLLGCLLCDFLQAELAASNCNNGLLKLRGNAGSHDLQLGTDTLKALRSLTSSGLSTPSI